MSVPNEGPGSPADAALVTAILLLSSRLSLEAFGARLGIAFARLGIPNTATAALIALLGPEGLAVPAPPEGPGAVATIQRGMIARRAMYLLAGARRLASGGNIEAERVFHGAHLAAERRRLEAAEQIDATAAVHGPILGWWAHKDAKTTRACRAAHGTNFSALYPPAMGWPGVLHGGQCRCKAVAPWTQAQILGPSAAQDEDVLLVPLER
jgi:hypothetical protein